VKKQKAYCQASNRCKILFVAALATTKFFYDLSISELDLHDTSDKGETLAITEVSN
jgi:hypothetical protein